jgi:hypothetical protein
MRGDRGLLLSLKGTLVCSSRQRVFVKAGFRVTPLMWLYTGLGDSTFEGRR